MWMWAKFQYFALAENVAEVHCVSRNIEQHGIFHVHQDILVSLNLTEVCSNFIQASTYRMDTFDRSWLQLKSNYNFNFFLHKLNWV